MWRDKSALNLTSIDEFDKYRQNGRFHGKATAEPLSTLVVDKAVKIINTQGRAI
jgi:hypothetical protein